MDKVFLKRMSLREAALPCNVPKSNIYDRTSLMKLGEKVTWQPKIGRFLSTISSEYQ